MTAVKNNSNNIGSSDVQGNNITIRGITPAVSARAAVRVHSQRRLARRCMWTASMRASAAVTISSGSRCCADRRERCTDAARRPAWWPSTRAIPTWIPLAATPKSRSAITICSITALRSIYPLSHTLAVRLAGDYRDQGEGYFDEASSRNGQHPEWSREGAVEADR